MAETMITTTHTAISSGKEVKVTARHAEGTKFAIHVGQNATLGEGVTLEAWMHNSPLKIAADTRIGNGATLKTRRVWAGAVIGANCHIAAEEILEDSIVGDNSCIMPLNQNVPGIGLIGPLTIIASDVEVRTRRNLSSVRIGSRSKITCDRIGGGSEIDSDVTLHLDVLAADEAPVLYIGNDVRIAPSTVRATKEKPTLTVCEGAHIGQGCTLHGGLRVPHNATVPPQLDLPAETVFKVIHGLTVIDTGEGIHMAVRQGYQPTAAVQLEATTWALNQQTNRIKALVSEVKQASSRAARAESSLQEQRKEFEPVKPFLEGLGNLLKTFASNQPTAVPTSTPA